MVYEILGMHKSGTTLISKILHQSGINMGDFDETIDYDEWNKYERIEPVIINKILLGRTIPDHSLQPGRPVASLRSGLKVIDYWVCNLVRKLNGSYGEWGFKDPRTCLTYAFWEKYIKNQKYILVVRSPLENFFHYSRRGSRLRRPWRGWRALRIWYEYNHELLKLIESRPDSKDIIVLEYSLFMTGDELFASLERFVGLKLVDARKNDMYRSKGERTVLYRFILLWSRLFASRDIEGLFKRLVHYMDEQSIGTA